MTNLIRHILEDEGFEFVNYLDDFGGAETWVNGHTAYAALGDTLARAGLGDSVEKRVPPRVSMTFLGILFDSIQFTLSIDEARLSEIRDLLDCWLVRQRCSRNELQSLLGKLNFVAACVRPGRVFTMRLLALLRDTPATGSIAIPEGTKTDLLWWRRFLVKYNRVSMMPESPWTEPDELLSTDACLDGCGGWFRGRFFQATFPGALKAKQLHINALELVTVLVALVLWAPQFRGRRMTLLCDNMTSVPVLNKGMTRDSFQADCLREITFLAAKHEFSIKVQHLSGNENRITDLV